MSMLQHLRDRIIRHLIILSSLLLASCTPGEQLYCQRYGTPAGHPEYPNCINHYFKMQNWFRGDYSQCLNESRYTYPDSLYDRGGWDRVGYIDRHGDYRSRTVRVDPDYYQHREVDAQRMRIIGPCMLNKGWNSPESWEAGRR